MEIFRVTTKLLLALLIASIARAEVRLPALFSDHMVLQQGRPIPVWGWAEDEEEVRVALGGHQASTRPKEGKWRVTLPAMEAGGPFELKVEGKNSLNLADVMVGEVWICSGQSNMEWPLLRTADPSAALSITGMPLLRLFTVPKLMAKEPVDDVKGSWAVSAPETAATFSAVAFFFGHKLQKELGVAVGLIHTSWGGSPAEVWMRHEVLAANPLYKRDILDAYSAIAKRHDEQMAEFKDREEAAKKEKRAFDEKPPRGPFWRPSELYNGMIAPLIPFAIRGAIWYQGESNASRAHQYRSLFPDMISNWRLDWGLGDFPFLAVQLAPWDKNRKRSIEEITATPGDSDWPELREAQVHATKVLPNVGLAVITDVGDKDDIHPQQKKPVGERLALAAGAIAYGHDRVWSGPMYRSMVIQGSQAIVQFDHTGGGLKARDGKLTGFSIAGADNKFVWADAVIRGDTVVVSNASVPNPVAVRYGWADFPVVNLENAEGLPASPFRTDEYPAASVPRQK